MEIQPGRLSLVEALALVTDVANRADRVAAGLRALREPQAAHMVDRLGEDADRAAAALRALLAPRPQATDWYQVHRAMWIRYGDPRDLAAMIEHVAQAPRQDG